VGGAVAGVGGGGGAPSLSRVASMPEDRQTEALEAEQRRREGEEEKLARSSTDEDESAQHARRADKARYLREKLKQRAASEREPRD
jgi:hypothetical protein